MSSRFPCTGDTERLLNCWLNPVVWGTQSSWSGSEFPVAWGAIVKGLGAIVTGKALSAFFLVVFHGDKGHFSCGKQLKVAIVADQTLARVGAPVKDHFAFAATRITQRLASLSGRDLANR
jgi:hypothetical protein